MEILSLIAALGGIECLRFILDHWIYRKYDRQKRALETLRNQVEVKGLESEKRRDQAAWFEERLQLRDDKIDSLYTELRKEQLAHLRTLRAKHDVELQLKEAEVRRCDVERCVQRIPPEYISYTQQKSSCEK